MVGELRQLMPEGNRSEIHDVFHKIKGSSAAMGAKRIHALAASAVQVCREDDKLGLLSELPDLIEAEYSRYDSEARRLL